MSATHQQFTPSSSGPGHCQHLLVAAEQRGVVRRHHRALLLCYQVLPEAAGAGPRCVGCVGGVRAGNLTKNKKAIVIACWHDD